MSDNVSANEHWSSQFAFILAALGSAIGLGNLWRFPYLVGENGGGAFIIIYLAFILVISIPALIATIMVGRRGQCNPILCLEKVSKQEGLSPKWGALGWLLVLSAYFLLTVFSVVASWILDFLSFAITDGFDGINASNAGMLYDNIKANPVRMSMWHGVFMGLIMFIVGKGIRKGIEKAVKMIMPALFIIQFCLVIYSLINGNAAAAFDFLFTPDFSKINMSVILLAVGQALLTLSVGGAGMLVYGAYIGDNVSIPRSSLVIAGMDTVVALLAGLMIFPIVFQYGLVPDQGPGLMFVTLPVAFGQMPGGDFFAILFFTLLLLAALSTGLSMFEPVVAWFKDQRGVSRVAGALIVGIATWLVGLFNVFSFNIWSEIRPLAFISSLKDLTIFGSVEYLTANLAMPLGSILISIFGGWMITEKMRREEFTNNTNPKYYKYWHFIVRYLVPSAIAIVFIASFYN
ncbi:MAG: sodium-dependent transporter [Kordiimonadaceae bacterium]|nr:sodium-dependent transporter [Kordiimonadaceae bacterium]